jgi:hypothetical protein
MVNIMEPGKTEKYPPLNPSPPKLKRKKCKAHSVCPWAFTLAAWNFSSQKNLSTFLAWPLPLTSPTFFYWIWLAPTKKIETMKVHKNWKFYGQMECLPLWLIDISGKGRRGGLWAKYIGLKQRAIGNTHVEHIGNLLEQNKNEKKKFSFFAPLPPKLKRKPMRNTLEICWKKGKKTWSFCLQNGFTD